MAVAPYRTNSDGKHCSSARPSRPRSLARALSFGVPLVQIYALLGAFAAAELVRLASELVYYRLDL